MRRVRLRRLPHGDYGLTISGEDFRLVKLTDGGAPSVSLWELRREGEHLGLRTFLTLADARDWATDLGTSAAPGHPEGATE